MSLVFLRSIFGLTMLGWAGGLDIKVEEAWLNKSCFKNKLELRPKGFTRNLGNGSVRD
jgi:hypothetical protein